MPATPHVACDLQQAAAAAGPPELLRLTPDCDSEDCQLVPLPTPGDAYYLLTAEDAQCRAATNANVANLVALEQHWAGVVIECDSRYVQRNVCMQRDLLELHAADVRNKAAAAALEAFYQLAGLEARRHYLDMAIDETSRSLERAEALRTADLDASIDRAELQARAAELGDQRLQLDFLRVQLNGQLQKLIGCPVSEFSFFWPQTDWTPDMTPLDADAELAVGLPQRFDLRGISLVRCQLDKSTLRVARGVLQVVDGTLGSVEPTEGWVHRLRCIRCNSHEVDVRCRQLAMLYQDTEQLATADIKGAAFQTALQQQRVALARQAVEDQRRRLFELEAKRDVSDVAVFTLSQARTRMYEAESNLIEQVAALKIADVRLRRSQAALSAECGFEPRLCWKGRCTGECTRCTARTCRPGDLPCRCAHCRQR